MRLIIILGIAAAVMASLYTGIVTIDREKFAVEMGRCARSVRDGITKTAGAADRLSAGRRENKTDELNGFASDLDRLSVELRGLSKRSVELRQQLITHHAVSDRAAE